VLKEKICSKVRIATVRQEARNEHQDREVFDGIKHALPNKDTRFDRLAEPYFVSEQISLDGICRTRRTTSI